MAIVLADWSVTRSTGAVRYIGNDHGGGSPSYATVIEFHRWLQDLADDASSVGDDEIDITDLLPSQRSTDNIIKLLGSYNIDDQASEHLYDGSIIQGTGGTEEIYDGILNFGNADVQIQLIQDGAVLTDDWWNFSGAGLNADAAQGISHRFMIKTRTGGVNVDGRRLIGTSRTYGNTFSEFSINGTSRGNNVLALTDSADLNNATIIGTIAALADISLTTQGYVELDINNDTVLEPYYSEWDIGANTINTFYERMKWLTRDGSVETIYGISGELFRGITHEIDIDTPTGTFADFESVTWSTGTGQMFAIDSTTAGTKMWIQLLTGIAPVDGDVITGTGTATVNITVVDRSSTISKPFIGASTGSAIIGAYGVGIEATDLAATDKVTDLGTNVITPPNNVSFVVGGLVSGEDRVLVAPWDGAATDSEGNPAIDKSQLTVTAGIINGAAITTIVVTTAIPSDTPATGDIRVLLASGKYRELSYTGWTGSTFTIPSTDFSGDQVDGTSNLWIAYLDKLAGATSESFTGVYLADRDFVVIVRDGGGTPIKQFISSASLGSSGGSITAIRTSDE